MPLQSIKNGERGVTINQVRRISLLATTTTTIAREHSEFIIIIITDEAKKNFVDDYSSV